MEVSYLSTVSNTGHPLVTCCEHGHSAIGLLTILAPCNTLLETLDAFVSDVCFGEEVNDGDVSGELHWCFADEHSIG